MATDTKGNMAKDPLLAGAKRSGGARKRLNTRSITMLDVAHLAGVSAQTVSRVLSDPQSVSEERRERVLLAIKETNYVHNLVASNLASSKSKTIAAIIPLISNSIFSETVQGLTQELLPLGYQVIIGITEYDRAKEEGFVRSILGRRPDGIFVIGTQHSQATRDLLKQSGVPVVESWEWVAHPIDYLVGFSNKKAMLDLLEHVFKAGYRKPVFCGVIKQGDSRAQDRLKGFEQGLKKYFECSGRAVILPDAGYSMFVGKMLLDTARQAYPDVDVLVCSSDIFAAGALLAAQRQGLRVPQDIAITGFGGYEVASQINPSLTTVAIPAGEIGSIAARLILQGASGKDRRVKVEARLVIGGST
jgi:LacI family gluconate utilization system Gnt-I transcriptional repressor